ncbi:Hypothetical protein NTJ_04082 [Nesidiocoris tenuis]|uniref:Legumain prodomain domain-containing protein n=1 Tax=Nesidiocoris tenuis TaxID=355587 RepID=A0ABN7AJB4_9HEMI|nr:Hypothetical protein NTJ_04082 [Nesidiocoris tenuis]
MRIPLAVLVCLVGVCVGSPTPTPLDKNAWALLVAGSKGFWNYRHQADVCHAYHVMIGEGIPPERIIVMMYDDIAYSEDNPTPGVIINKPNGTNVYAGVKIDYKGDDVSSSNFLNILTGNAEAMKDIGTGRVIESDEKTNIFVYFSDHGGTGLICFPNDNLLATDLEATLRTMRQKKQYNKLIMYIEACESGSMFDNILEEDTDVYAMTAAARDESSYAYYCDDSTCLGDEFSVKWLERMEKEKAGTLDTFFHQFQGIRTSVIKSHVNIYGDFSIGPDALTPNKDVELKRNKLAEVEKRSSYVNSRDVPLHYFRKRMQMSNDVNDLSNARRDLDNVVFGRKTADRLLDELVTIATAAKPHLRATVLEDHLPLDKSIFPCYKELLENFNNHCFSHANEYFYQHYYKFANMCILNLDTKNVIKSMPSTCRPYKATTKATIV